MPPDLQDVQFTGLRARENANRIPFDAALKAQDCWTDNDCVEGRSAYRSVLSGAVAGSGAFQHGGRFRPSASVARFVEVIAGEVFVITDPSSETASDGVATSLGTPFGSSDNICGAQLGTSYYLGTDGTGAMQRITWTSPSTFALESLEAIPAPGRPVGSVSNTLSWVLFSSKTPTYTGTIIVQDNSKTGFTNMDSAWRGFSATDGGNDDPATGAAALYDMGSGNAIVGTNFDWVAVAITPHDEGGSAGNRRINIQVSNDGSNYASIGAIWDVPPTAGSPNLIFCDLRNLNATIRASIRYWKFLVEGASGGRFAVYGYMPLPRMFQPNPPSLYVDFYNTSTGQMSALSDAALTSTNQVLTVSQAVAASYPDTYGANDTIKKTSASLDIFNATNQRVFNRAAGIAMPKPEDIGGTITLTGTTSAYSGSLLVRVWEDVANGRRLVTSATVAASTPYSFTFGYSDAVLANQLYRPGGVGPKCTALAARSQRLISIYQNRVYISSYVPTSAEKNSGGGSSVNVFPQWPDIATEDSDGWSFDIAPSPKEQGLVLDGSGDALYICTTEATYAMTDLRPNSLPYLVWKRGAVGRNAGGYFEDRFLWAAWDGVYEGVGKSVTREFSFDVRGYYIDTFAPDSTTCIGYNLRERALYVACGTRYMRFYFPQKEWSYGTLSHTIRQIVGWIDPASLPQMWLCTSDRKIGRWQATATRDMEVGTDTTTGTAIPDWVYSTGFSLTPSPSTVKAVLVDADGPVRVTAAKTVAGTVPSQGRVVEIVPGPDMDEMESEGHADFRAFKFRLEFTGANTTTLRRAMWDRDPIAAMGG